MHFSWTQHQHLASRLGTVQQQQWGAALALMGVALLMLSEDLLARESRNANW